MGKVRGPSSYALTAANDDEVEVLNMSQQWITLKLIKTKPTWYPKLHFIIFPGPFYSPLSYTPLARELCKRGSIVSIWNGTFTTGELSSHNVQVALVSSPAAHRCLLHSASCIPTRSLTRSQRTPRTCRP